MSSDFDDEYLPFFTGDSRFNVLDYSSSKYRKLKTKEERERWIQDVHDWYRNVHGFPYPTYEEEELHYIAWKLRNMRDSELEFDNTLPSVVVGTEICNSFFPNMYKTKQILPAFQDTGKGRGYRLSPMETFENEKQLKKVIRLCFDYKPNAAPAQLRGAISLVNGTASKFNPLVVRCLVDRYTPQNGVYYDFACGWGARLLGAKSSRKNIRYIGVDPNSETHDNLVKLNQWLAATYKYDPVTVLLRKTGSEEFCPKELHGKVDFSFSSPPYFNLERYSDEATQCYNKFPSVSQWLHGYLFKTLENIHRLLKPGGTFALNMVDYQGASFVSEALKCVDSLGFEKVAVHQMPIYQRIGSSNKDGETFKIEEVYVYRKPA
jgi:hypothetical protein